jgi:hypothetical protein
VRGCAHRNHQHALWMPNSLSGNHLHATLRLLTTAIYLFHRVRRSAAATSRLLELTCLQRTHKNLKHYHKDSEGHATYVTWERTPAAPQPNPTHRTRKKKYRQMEHRDRNQVPPGTAKPGSLELALLIALKSLAGTLPAPGRGAHTSAERVCTQPRCWTLPSMFDKLCHTTKIPSHYFQWK